MLMLDLFKRKLNIYFFNKYTLKKFFNLMGSVFSYRYSKSPIVKSHPIRMVIDTGNICQLRCPLCPTGLGRTTREKSFMDLESFKKIIDEAGEYLCEVDLYNWGEPFLNKDLSKMIRYAKNAGIKVSLNANLNLLKEEWMHEIVEAQLDQLTVSIDGASQETYSKYRIGGNFDIVLNNLKKLIEVRKQHKSKYPHITWQFLVMSHNEEEIEKCKKMAHEIGVDEVYLRPMRCDMGTELLMSDQEKVESIKNWLPSQEKYSRYNYKTKQKKNPLAKCLFQTTTMVVNPNGSVSPCCGVYDEKWDFGNALKDGVFRVWNNETYVAARKAVLDKDTSNPDLICTHCIKNGFLEY